MFIWVPLVALKVIEPYGGNLVAVVASICKGIWRVLSNVETNPIAFIGCADVRTKRHAAADSGD